jgi:Zn-dependent metalloprotease
MWQHVAEHGNARQRERAHSTLAHTAQILSARTATLIEPHAQGPSAKMRQVYDAGNRQILPGKLVITEQRSSTTDTAAKQAFDGSGAAYDFLSNVYMRNSIDDHGMRLDSTVHYGDKFDNALWTGTQMVYGDGDGILFNGFTGHVEIDGHELAHGMTQHDSGLEYHGQSGALNEHLSDVFGILIKQWRNGTTARRSTWLIGEGLLGKNVHGIAIRSMGDPGSAFADRVLGPRELDPAAGIRRIAPDGLGIAGNSLPTISGRFGREPVEQGDPPSNVG